MSLQSRRIEDDRFHDTELCYTLTLISGRYKPIILYCLMEYEPVRFNQMRRYIPQISDRTLSLNLKEMEKDEHIIRTPYPQLPPRVEYSLTDLGRSLAVTLYALCDWGVENRPVDRY